MALGGVVAHAVEGAADLAHGFVVERAAAVAFHEPAGLAQAGRRLVEVDLPAVGVTVGEAPLDVLDAALEAVEGVTGEGVGARGGHAPEGARRDADRESARDEALAQPGAWA